MDKYIVAGKVMKVRMMDKSQIHPELFKNWNRVFKDKRPQRISEFAAKYNDKPHVEVDGVMIPKITKSQVISRAKGDQRLMNKLKGLNISLDLVHLQGESE